MTVELAIAAVHRDKIVLRLGVRWPGAEGTHVRYKVLTARASRIVDMRPADDLEAALRRAGLG